jgi:hypothetical protein
MQAEELLQRIDKLALQLRWLVRAALLAATGFVFYMWCGFQLDCSCCCPCHPSAASNLGIAWWAPDTDLDAHAAAGR